ncbi:MAG: outer membrane protein transport protein [Pseudomonadota bacterium]|nr:outer membrane protein transport protein [Pseudomonadota bacterium]
MYGIYENQVAINNVDPRYGDGKLSVEDTSWGLGANLGLLYEIDAGTRIGLTWNSQVDLDFEGANEFSNLAPRLNRLFGSRGLLDSSLKVGIRVPQQVMGSLFKQVDERWAVLGSVGWQQWSQFGQVQIGIDNSLNPTSVTTDLDFEDTWHVALGAQYRISDPWSLNFGIAYDSGFQSGDVSPLLPINSAWRFGIGGQRQLSKTSYWGIAAEYLYGGTLDTNLQSDTPVALGGHGDLVGSYENTGTLFVAGYYNWQF